MKTVLNTNFRCALGPPPTSTRAPFALPKEPWTLLDTTLLGTELGTFLDRHLGQHVHHAHDHDVERVRARVVPREGDVERVRARTLSVPQRPRRVLRVGYLFVRQF